MLSGDCIKPRDIHIMCRNKLLLLVSLRTSYVIMPTHCMQISHVYALYNDIPQ